jgi:GxxExxY protein
MNNLTGIDRMNRIEEIMSKGRLHEQLTGKILEASFEVIRELGAGFLEGVYQNALLIALRQKDIQAEARVPLLVRFRGEVVGEYFADLLVDGKVIVELKAVKAGFRTSGAAHQLFESDWYRGRSVD